MKKLHFAILTAVIAASLLTPFAVSAQFGPLIDPDQCSGTLLFPEGEKYCTLCDGLNAVKRAMNLLIELGLAVAVVIIAYGGILIMTGGANPGNIDAGRKAITGSVVGVAIALLAWLIVNQIFYLLVTNGLTGQPWNNIKCPPEE